MKIAIGLVALLSTLQPAFAGVTKTTGSWGGRCQTPSLNCTDSSTGQPNGKTIACYADARGNAEIYASCTHNTGPGRRDGWVECTEKDKNGAVIDSYSNSCE